MIILTPLFEEHYYQTELEKFGYEILINEEIYLEQDDYDIFMKYLSEGFTSEQNAKIKLAGDNKAKEARTRVGDTIKAKTYQPGFLRTAIDKVGDRTPDFIKRGLNSDFVKPIKYGVADIVAKRSGRKIGENISNIEHQQRTAVANLFEKKKFNTNFNKSFNKLDKHTNNLAWALQYRKANESDEQKTQREDPAKIAKDKATNATPVPAATPPRTKKIRIKQPLVVPTVATPPVNTPPINPQTNTTAQNVNAFINNYRPYK
jgi:hypothetical protein